MTQTVFAIFAASLLGSPHCVAMCGPFVAFYSGAEAPDRGSRPSGFAHVAYSVGRLVAYLSLGWLAGSLGSALNLAGAAAGVARLAALVTGTLLCAWGVATLATLYGIRVAVLHAPRWMHGGLSRVFGAVRAQPALVRAGVTGLATALLPCGWLYVFVAAAAATGSPLRGALSMLVFWSGTLPLMVTAGFGLQRLTGRLRRRLPAFSAVVMVVIGLLTIAGRLERAPGTLHQHEHARAVLGSAK